MEESIQQLESYLGKLKNSGEQLPRQLGKATPHFRRISAAAGIDFSYLLKEPYRQRVMLAAAEVGFTPLEGSEDVRREARFNQNRAALDNYLRWLKENAFKLPEDPRHRGRVFFSQVILEAGLSSRALSLKRRDGEKAHNAQLKRMIENASRALGIEVRILPFSPGQQLPRFTYEQLFARGTSERREELRDRPSAGAQLSNCRYALNLFLKTLGIEKSVPVGQELTADYKRSVEAATGRIVNEKSRKKFQTEINWWYDLYARLIKEPSIPADFHQAIAHLVDRSGLSISVLERLIGASPQTLKHWYQGRHTPSGLSIKALGRMESLFKLPAGILTNKVSRIQRRIRFRRSELPIFLQEDPTLFHEVSRHLPDNFCTLSLSEQEKVVETIRTDILHGDDDYARRQMVLTQLPYRLKEWPADLRDEFEAYADFKMAERPPLGMQRSGKWRLTTKKKHEADLSFLFGALRLPPDAEDTRVRGLGLPVQHLTLALIACPALIDWYIRFRCETRNQYTDYVIRLLNNFISMLRPDTGWVRQNPQLGSRLRHVRVSHQTNLVPQELVERALTDWAGVCDAAVKKYVQLISEVEPLITVARDPFHRIEGILDLDDPMDAFDLMLQGMREDMPNRHTQPVYYHTAVRDRALVALIAVTGLRRSTIMQLDYTGDETGNLYMKEGRYVLSVPRRLFKVEDSSFFGPKRSKKDYLNVLPNVYDINELFSEYLDISRPFLIDRYHGGIVERPLFVTSDSVGPARSAPNSPRLSVERIYDVYAGAVERYLVENKARGIGIPKVKKTGPQSARHVRGTKVVRKTRSFKSAGDANQNSERMAREHYSRLLPSERNAEVNRVLFDDDDDEE